MSLSHPSIAEMAAATGADFLGVDLEHSTINQEQAQRIIAAGQAGGLACLVRVASHNGEQIRRVLDSGADGLIIPNVRSREEVERIVEWSKYPPIGKRGYGVARAQGYGSTFEDYTARWNERSAIILQIESREGVEASDELVAHEAVDGVMIGPYDLSGSFGVPGQLSHPQVVAASQHVIEACRRGGKACGTQIVDPDLQNVTAALQAGYTFVVLASDVFILWKWAERMRKLVDAVTMSKSRRRSSPRSVTAQR